MQFDDIPKSEWKYVTGQKNGHSGRTEVLGKEQPDVKADKDTKLNQNKTKKQKGHIMPSVSDLGESKYLKQADCNPPLVLTIDGYENFLLGVIEGDQSLFLRWDEVEWAWRIVDPVLRVWASEDKAIDTYEAGSWGAVKSRRLFDNEDLHWRHSIYTEENNG